MASNWSSTPRFNVLHFGSNAFLMNATRFSATFWRARKKTFSMQSVQYTLLHLTKDCLFAPSSSFLRPSATALNPGEEETESSSFCYIHSPSTQKASFALCSIFPRTSFSSRTRMGKSMGFLLLRFPFLLFPFLLAAFSPLAVSQGDFLYFSSLLLCVPSALSLFSVSSFFFSSSSLSLFFSSFLCSSRKLWSSNQIAYTHT